MYQEVLTESAFGELSSMAKNPASGATVSSPASNQSNEARLNTIAPQHFDVVVIDEFHHAEAKSHKRLPTTSRRRNSGTDRHSRACRRGRRPRVLRRAGRRGTSTLGRLDQQPLCPFHYFGIYDPTEIDKVAWKRGGYDVGALSAIYTGNDACARIIPGELTDKVDDVHRMRASDSASASSTPATWQIGSTKPAYARARCPPRRHPPTAETRWRRCAIGQSTSSSPSTSSTKARHSQRRYGVVPTADRVRRSSSKQLGRGLRSVPRQDRADRAGLRRPPAQREFRFDQRFRRSPA